jgi:hypothetical protein
LLEEEKGKPLISVRGMDETGGNKGKFMLFKMLKFLTRLKLNSSQRHFPLNQDKIVLYFNTLMKSLVLLLFIYCN